jgi:hypothetical protein
MPLTDILDALPAETADDALLARLSPPALRAFHSVCAGWRLSAVEGRRLLGCPAEPPLNVAALRTIDAVLAIHAGLRHIHGDREAAAGRWLRMPNPLPPFSGDAPLAVMTRDGKAGKATVLAFLREWRE